MDQSLALGKGEDLKIRSPSESATSPATLTPSPELFALRPGDPSPLSGACFRIHGSLTAEMGSSPIPGLARRNASTQGPDVPAYSLGFAISKSLNVGTAAAGGSGGRVVHVVFNPHLPPSGPKRAHVLPLPGTLSPSKSHREMGLDGIRAN